MWQALRGNVRRAQPLLPPSESPRLPAGKLAVIALIAYSFGNTRTKPALLTRECSSCTVPMHQFPTVLIPATIRKAQIELPVLPTLELQRPIKPQLPQLPQSPGSKPQRVNWGEVRLTTQQQTRWRLQLMSQEGKRE